MENNFVMKRYIQDFERKKLKICKFLSVLGSEQVESLEKFDKIKTASD